MSELDDLMSLDPFSLSSQDLSKIITGTRLHRSRLASGVKPKREGKGEGPKIDLASLGLVKKPEVVATNRRKVT